MLPPIVVHRLLIKAIGTLKGKFQSICYTVDVLQGRMTLLNDTHVLANFGIFQHDDLCLLQFDDSFQ